MTGLVVLLIQMVDQVLQNLVLMIASDRRQNEAIRELSRKVNQLEAEIRELKKKIP
ncbi:MAG TPA: hypothetical protein VNQ79_06695 [Blastocatellia bacterium]|nr:hypothetical protein [Blastocatellia bacterium]